MRSTLRHLSSAVSTAAPVIRLSNATFYKGHPSDGGSSKDSKALFPNLSISLPSYKDGAESWGIIGAQSGVRTAFLHALRGDFICQPPTARSYPYLSTDEIAKKDPSLRSPINAIKYVGFDADRGGSSLRGAYLSQRYESKREINDFSLKDYLLGQTELNASEESIRSPPKPLLESTIKDLKLGRLLNLPVAHLSNGQTRRSKIAKALLSAPEVLLLDSPFMGLDLKTVEQLSGLLKCMAKTQAPRIVMSLRADEHIPEWISRFIMLLRDYKVYSIGTPDEMIHSLRTVKESLPVKTRKAEEPNFDLVQDARSLLKQLNPTTGTLYTTLKVVERARKEASEGIPPDPRMSHSIEGYPIIDQTDEPEREPLIEMKGVHVAYRDGSVVGNWKQEHEGTMKDGLWWTIRRGQRWGVFGPNGSGKTTLTALITSDHPQSYSLPISFFGRSRLPSPGKPGISIFDLQSRMGFSSPELHAFFPKHLSARQVLESAWADTPLTKPKLSSDDEEVVTWVLRFFQNELCPDLGYTNMQLEERNRTHDPNLKWDEPSKYETTKLSAVAKKRATDIYRELLDPELRWAEDRTFGRFPFPAQRLLLFLRAIIKRPDIVVLDEAFSGMDASVVQKCHVFLARGDHATLRNFRRRRISGAWRGQTVTRSDTSLLGLSKFPGLSKEQALIVIAHRKEEVPGNVRHWLCLPEPGEGPPRFGEFDGPVEMDENKWRTIWNLPLMDVGPLGEFKYPVDTSKPPTVRAWQKSYFSRQTKERKAILMARSKISMWKSRQQPGIKYRRKLAVWLWRAKRLGERVAISIAKYREGLAKLKDKKS